MLIGQLVFLFTINKYNLSVWCHFLSGCLVQGGHILAKMKFPVFSLSFPCVTKIFPVLFLRKN